MASECLVGFRPPERPREDHAIGKGEPSPKGFIRPGTAGKSGAGRPQGPQAKQQPEAALAGVVRCEVPAAREKEPLRLFRVNERGCASVGSQSCERTERRAEPGRSPASRATPKSDKNNRKGSEADYSATEGRSICICCGDTFTAPSVLLIAFTTYLFRDGQGVSMACHSCR